jgi:hypothetical protein
VSKIEDPSLAFAQGKMANSRNSPLDVVAGCELLLIVVKK